MACSAAAWTIAFELGYPQVLARDSKVPVTLRVTEQITKDVATVTVTGDLDVYASDGLRQVLRRFSCARHHRVVVDLTACTFLSMTCRSRSLSTVTPAPG